MSAELCQGAMPCGSPVPARETELPWKSVEDFYRQKRRELVVRLFYLLASRQDAEDVVHDAFIQAARKWHTLQNKSAASATSWLYKTAARMALNKRRQRKRWREVALGDLTDHQLISSNVSPERAYEVQLALDVLKELSARQRKTYLLRHYFGFEIEDIANLLGCGPSTVRVHLHRAQETITRKLGHSGESSARKPNRDGSGVKGR